MTENFYVYMITCLYISFKVSECKLNIFKGPFDSVLWESEKIELINIIGLKSCDSVSVILAETFTQHNNKLMKF